MALITELTGKIKELESRIEKLQRKTVLRRMLLYTVMSLFTLNLQSDFINFYLHGAGKIIYFRDQDFTFFSFAKPAAFSCFILAILLSEILVFCVVQILKPSEDS